VGTLRDVIVKKTGGDMAIATVPADPDIGEQYGPESRELVQRVAANEIVFAVVGHVGSGTSEVADALKSLLEGTSLVGGPFDATILKAREGISEWARQTGRSVPDPNRIDLESVTQMQNLGDEMRLSTGDNAAVARSLIRAVRSTRAKKLGKDASKEGPILPDGNRRAYILDSLRHPAEVELLRRIYQDSFVLIGVVCEETVRERRVSEKYQDAGLKDAQEFMIRDSRAPEKHGQRVSDTFHLSDFFVDNTANRFLDLHRRPNPAWTVTDELARLVEIITHARIVRPTPDEMGMYHAYGAQMRSACLSRQVGASLVDEAGNVIATGTNEVPRAGGGLYGEGFDPTALDHRCAFRGTAFCSNTKEQNSIIQELIDSVPELSVGKNPEQLSELKRRLRSTRIGGLIEFSRAVHAEMDALLSAAREGISTVGARLYCTTFPCHYCARHLVAAGIAEVQFIEPYLKSQALALHDDAITMNPVGWLTPREAERRNQDANQKVERKVLFRPFTGVAPRLYRQAFLKDRDLKNDVDGRMEYGQPAWGSAWQLRAVSYVELEARLAKMG